MSRKGIWNGEDLIQQQKAVNSERACEGDNAISLDRKLLVLYQGACPYSQISKEGILHAGIAPCSGLVRHLPAAQKIFSQERQGL